MTAARKFAETIAHRGYRPMWSSGCLCPGCGRSHWHVGRTGAECAFCATALPFAPGEPAPAGKLIPFRRSLPAPEAPAAIPLAAGASNPERDR